MDADSSDKPRRTRGGISPHFGFRLEPAIAVRIDTIRAAMALRAQGVSLPAPDRSDIMRAIVLEGLAPLEAKLGIASPTDGAPPVAPPAAPSSPPAEPSAPPASAPAEHVAPGAASAAHRGPSASAGRPAAQKGKATAAPKGKATAAPKGKATAAPKGKATAAPKGKARKG
jgi:hypothetical protein